jgi:anti-sigma factor RsiW
MPPDHSERPDDGETEPGGGDPDHGFDLVAYVDDRAEVGEQRAVEAHLRRCRACDEAVAELRSTLIWLGLARAERATDAAEIPDPGDD